MNRVALNGGLLGTGTPSPFSYISLTAFAVAVSSISVFGSNYVDINAEGRSYGSASFSVRQLASSQVQGSASYTLNDLVVGAKFESLSGTGTAYGSLDPNVQYQIQITGSGVANASVSATSVAATFANSSVLARAFGTNNFGRLAAVGSSVTAEATLTGEGWRGAVASSAVFARAAAYSPYFTEDAPTSDERVMILPDEGRLMELPA